jgi:hypothetical protein
MTLKRYNTLWAICAAIVFASAWLFDRLKCAALQNLVGGIAIVACIVIVVNHFKMYAQIQRENNEDEQVPGNSSPK